jgi:hypothetical protein
MSSIAGLFCWWLTSVWQNCESNFGISKPVLWLLTRNQNLQSTFAFRVVDLPLTTHHVIPWDSNTEATETCDGSFAWGPNSTQKGLLYWMYTGSFLRFRSEKKLCGLWSHCFLFWFVARSHYMESVRAILLILSTGAEWFWPQIEGR